MGKGRQRGVPLSPRERRFASLIVSLRQARGLSQAALAERADLAVDTIGRLERSTFSPSLETLFKLADGLDLSLGTILVAFESSERDAMAELIDLAHRLEPAELDAALQVLTVLVELVRVAGEGGEDD